MSSQSNSSWAKLLALTPAQKHILLSKEPPSPKLSQSKNQEKWRIYQNQQNKAMLLNLTIAPILVNGTILQIHEEIELSEGDKVEFVQGDGDMSPQEILAYLFYFTKSQNTMSELKRPRDEKIEFKDPPSGHKKKLLSSANDNLSDELTCTICRKILYNCMSVSPCQHNFCSYCLAGYLPHSTRCPICPKEITSVKENDLLQKLIGYTIKHDPKLQERSQEEKEVLDKNDSFKKGFDLKRDQFGVYVGFYKNGKREGKGKMKYQKDGIIYDGEWKNDKRDGKGKIFFQDGDVFKGEWVCGEIKTHGEMKFSDGIYIGEMKEFQMHGKGVYKYKNGDVYDGDWKKGQKEGVGKFVWKSGEEYFGEWKGGNKEGNGEYKDITGVVWKGLWKDDKMIGEGKIEVKVEVNIKTNEKKKVCLLKKESEEFDDDKMFVNDIVGFFGKIEEKLVGSEEKTKAKADTEKAQTNHSKENTSEKKK